MSYKPTHFIEANILLLAAESETYEAAVILLESLDDYQLQSLKEMTDKLTEMCRVEVKFRARMKAV